jgi:hypothetical protein
LPARDRGKAGPRAALLLLAGAVPAVLPAPSWADLTGAIPLQGSVTAAVAVTPTSQSSNIDFSQGATTVGTVVESSNDPRGYIVTLQSANAITAGASTGVMKGSPGNPDTLNYTISYGGTPVTLVNGSSVVTDASGPTPSGGISRPVVVTFTSTPVAADTYTDTLTFITQSK